MAWNLHGWANDLTPVPASTLPAHHPDVFQCIGGKWSYTLRDEHNGWVSSAGRHFDTEQEATAAAREAMEEAERLNIAGQKEMVG